MDTKYLIKQYPGCIEINEKVSRDERHQQNYYRDCLIKPVKKVQHSEKTLKLADVLAVLVSGFVNRGYQRKFG